MRCNIYQNLVAFIMSFPLCFVLLGGGRASRVFQAGTLGGQVRGGTLGLEGALPPPPPPQPLLSRLQGSDTRDTDRCSPCFLFI